MARDLTNVLREVAAQPSTSLDAAGLVDAALRSRRRRQLGIVGVLALVALVVVGTVISTSLAKDSDRVELIEQPPASEGVADRQALELFHGRTAVASAVSDTTMWLWGGRDSEQFFHDGVAIHVDAGVAVPIPASPLSRRAAASAVWTGSELIVCCGELSGYEPFYDAAAFEPSSGHWRTIKPAPDYAHRTSAVWVGGRMVMWGGYGLKSSAKVFTDGAAYDPVSDRWSHVPEAPLVGRVGHSATVIGEQLLIWGGAHPYRSQLMSDGALYDPQAETWTVIAPAPIVARRSHSAVWTGRELIVWGGSVGDDTKVVGDGAAYDPRTDTWRLIAPSPLSARFGSAVAWAGDRMVVWGGYNGREVFSDGAVYDPSSDRWTLTSPAPIFGRWEASWASVGGSLIVAAGHDARGTYFGDAAKYSPTTNQWSVVAPGPATELAKRPAPECKGGPKLALSPSSGRVGTRVQFEGRCFKGFKAPRDILGGYGLFLLRASSDCELLAWGDDVSLHLRNGQPYGSFTVPETGGCFQDQTGASRPVLPGRYTVGLGTHGSSVATFVVTDPGSEDVESPID